MGGSSDTIEAQVLAKLTAAGHTIGSENSGTIQGITLSSNETITIEEGGNTAEVTATLNTSGGSTNYVLIDGLYYPLNKKANGDIELEKTGKKTLEDSTVSLSDVTVTPTGSINATLDSITGKVTITSSNVTADENATVKLQNNGTDYATINVAVKKVSLAEISPATATVEIGKTTNLSVTLADYQKGTVTWSVTSGGSYASVPANSTGTSVAVTGAAVGNATITATYRAGSAEVSKTRNVKVVTEISVIGDYVNYNVPYTDMYSDTDTETEGLQGYNFTATDGWRILSRTRNATDPSKYDLKIISTGIPALLYYHYSTNAGNQNNGWWGTDSQVEELYGSTYSTAGYNYNNRGYPNYYAATGLQKNFSSIIFDSATTQSTANKGCWQSVAGKTSGIGADFIASGFTDISVHNLTLKEINTARNLPSGYSSTTSTNNKDGDMGLFYLRNLTNENDSFGYTNSTSYSYLLGNPGEGRSAIYLASDSGNFPMGGGIDYGGGVSGGLRPVIEIKGVTMTQNVDTGVWTITQ